MNRCRYFSAPLVALALLAGTGCGPTAVKVKGVVKLDGNPVEGATVAFVAEDGKTAYTGFTEAGGTFTLVGPDGKPGVPAGNYKVTVVKHAMMTGGEAAGPGSPDYMKQMEKMSKEAAKESGVGKGGLMPGMPRPGAKGGHEKTELPQIYASAEKTPLSVKVPPPSDPVTIDLKSKP
jgi:hypothetical protein